MLNTKYISLLEAVRKGDLTKVSELVRSKGLPDSLGGYCLLCDAFEGLHVEVALYLIRQGVDVYYDLKTLYIPDLSYKLEKAPIHYAVIIGNIDIVVELLRRGARLHSRDKYGQVPLHIAVQKGDIEIVRLVLDEESLNAIDSDGYTPLTASCITGDLEIVELLISSGAKVDYQSKMDKHTALHVAAQYGHPRVGELLLNNHADINAKNKKGFTPLHLAFQRGKRTMIEILIRRKANVNDKLDDNIPLLHMATRKGDENLVLLLLDHNAEIDTQDDRGYTALHYAILNGNLKLMKLLISRHADCNLLTKCGESTLQFAIKNCKTYTLIETLLQCKVDRNYRGNERGDTALHLAVRNGGYRIVELLLNNGYDVNSTNKRGRTPLDRAIECLDGEVRDDDEPSYMYNIVECMKHHMIKLKNAGLYLTERNLRWLSDKIADSTYSRDCREELKRIKDRKLDQDISLYDALIKCNVRILSEKSIEISKSIDYKDYPLYESIMKTNFKFHKQRSKLIDLGIESFYALNRRQWLPLEMIEKIVIELENRDLRNLIYCYYILCVCDK